MFFVLLILESQEKGITGYRLQTQFNFPRGSILRILDETAEKGYAKIDEVVDDGRNQKLYSITGSGKDFLKELKAKWALQFAMLSEMAPPDEYGFPFTRGPFGKRFMDDMEQCKSKDDAIDLVRGMRSFVTRFMNRLEKRLSRFSAMKDRFSKVIEEIEQMPSFDKESVKRLLTGTVTSIEVPDEDDEPSI